MSHLRSCRSTFQFRLEAPPVRCVDGVLVLVSAKEIPSGERR